MTVNPDLARERERSASNFDAEVLTNLLDGGRERTTRRRALERLISNDPTGIFSNAENRYLHRTERHTRALAKHVRLVELCRKVGIGDEEGCDGDVIRSDDWPTVTAAVSDVLPTTLHWVMFVPNIASLCDDEQRAHWLPLCRDWRVIGCYAQTELGHGSNVRGLETTATFLPESDGGLKGGSWVINSPTITSAKFWPGTLGRTANHAMVIAQLIDGEGKNRGVHNFIVPLRSMDDHKPLPGVTTGDVGPKLGYNNMDNGFAILDNVVIPRRNMAMRFATVDESGKYSKKSVSDATEKVAYITMMQVRAYIVNESGNDLAKACTVAIRYSAVRKQGFDGKGEEEVQVLDYRQQQHRLFSMLATSYCFRFTGRRILRHLRDIEVRLVEKEGAGADAVTKAEISDVHATTSALKSFMTGVAADGIEDCRKACGGHGYLHCSGLPELSTTYLMNPTVEGDNNMLPQQVLKVLLKVVAAVQGEGAEAATKRYKSCDCLYLIPELAAIMGGEERSCAAGTEEELTDTEVLLSAYRHRAARLLLEAASAVQAGVAAGKAMDEAWNGSQVLMGRASRAHALALLLESFRGGASESRRSGMVGPREAAVLDSLCRLFGLYWMERDIGDFLEDRYLSSEQASWVRSAVLGLLGEVRPNAVGLVDAWDFSDFLLDSALGRYDGDVYPAIMEAAGRDPLNSTEPGPGYEESLKRLTAGGVGKYKGVSGTHARL